MTGGRALTGMSAAMAGWTVAAAMMAAAATSVVFMACPDFPNGSIDPVTPTTGNSIAGPNVQKVIFWAKIVKQRALRANGGAAMLCAA